LVLPHNPVTGEITEASPRTPTPAHVETAAKAAGASGTGAPADLLDNDHLQLADDVLAKAAKSGMAMLRTAWMNLDPHEREALKARLDTHKATATAIDEMA
jgi:hypothetical protein